MQVRDRKKRIFAACLNCLLYFIVLPFRLFGAHNTYRSTNPRSFLIVRLDHIGDVILSTPIYHSIKERFPDARITVLCGSWAVNLLSNNPYVDSLMVLDCPWWVSIRTDAMSKGGFFGRLFKTIKAIRSEHFDVFIDLRGDLRHIFLFGWLPGIPERIAYTRSGGGFLLTKPYPYENMQHEIARSYKLLQAFEPIKKYWKPELYSKSEDLLSIQNKVGRGFDINKNAFAVIFNGGRSKLRRLNNAKIGTVCNMLHDSYALKCCYVGDKSDFYEGEKIRDLLGSNADWFHNLCGLCNFMELRELISRAALFIGTDSSVLHIAASTDTPSIALFGPVSPKQTKPIGHNKKVVYHAYPCSPCLQEFCIVTKSREVAQCMEDITVADIMQQVRQLQQGRLA